MTEPLEPRAGTPSPAPSEPRAGTPSGPPSADGIARDARDLHRGLAANLLGYVLKLANPVLLILAVRRYGPAAFGLYSLAQAVVLFATRVTAFGLDKALLWWVPRQSDETARRGLRPAFRTAGLASVVVAALLVAAAHPAVLRALGIAPETSTTLRLVALGLPLQVAMDLLVGACMGRRRVATQLLVKDTIVPTLFVGLALVFHLVGLAAVGLALAFVLGNAAGVVAALWAFRGAFAGTSWPRDEGGRAPPELARYALPMWLAEMSNSLLLRMDTWAVGLFAQDLAAVGVWAVVARLANQVRDIRRAFDPIVLAITSSIGAELDRDRLRSGFSRATFLVTATQIPVFVFLLCFARFLLPLYGRGFEAGGEPVVILCAFWLVGGVANLAGIVVSAFGRSRLTLLNTLVTIVVLGVASALLIPRWGIVGAAFALGISTIAQGTLQLVQMRGVTGAWNFDRTVPLPALLGLVSGAALVVVWLLARDAVPELAARAIAFGAFAALYGVGLVRVWPRAPST